MKRRSNNEARRLPVFHQDETMKRRWNEGSKLTHNQYLMTLQSEIDAPQCKRQITPRIERVFSCECCSFSANQLLILLTVASNKLHHTHYFQAVFGMVDTICKSGLKTNPINKVSVNNIQLISTINTPTFLHATFGLLFQPSKDDQRRPFSLHLYSESILSQNHNLIFQFIFMFMSW